MTQPAGLLQQLHLATLVDEVQASAAIEGVTLPRAMVAAAVAQRLGLQPASRPALWTREGASKVWRRQYHLLKLLELLASGGAEWIDVRRYMWTAGVSKATATRDLAELVACGQLQRDGTGKASRYRLRRIAGNAAHSVRRIDTLPAGGP